MTERKRYTVIDILRAVAIINMIFYHAMWDLTRIFGVDAPWFSSDGAHIWQRAIRWAFILLSGFCWSLSRNKLRRSLTVMAASAIISGVTAIFMPDSIIIFGVLSLIGTGMLLTVPLDKIFCKLPPVLGAAVCLVLFLFTQNVSRGWLGFFDIQLIPLPDVLYSNIITAFFGFTYDGFYSSDYVPLLPWLFSFWMGYFIFRFFEKRDLLKYLTAVSFKPLEWVGRHSLEIYLLHQPLVYGVLYVFFNFLK